MKKNSKVLKTSEFFLYGCMIGISNIAPPVIVDSIIAAAYFGEVFHPPFMVLADIPIPPI